jgi:coenzyme PQQ precursor peptide PqqA
VVLVSADRGRSDRRPAAFQSTWRLPMQWTQPAFEDLRFGFEITMYIAAR